MKKAAYLLLAISLSVQLQAQVMYDSVTISHFTDRFVPAWPGVDSVTTANYARYLRDERTIWVNPHNTDTVTPRILKLTNEIQQNGEGSINRCFSPRHSINYYNHGRIVMYLLVCFQCDGLLFSQKERRDYLLSREVRLQQMEELKLIFKDLR